MDITYQKEDWAKGEPFAEISKSHYKECDCVGIDYDLDIEGLSKLSDLGMMCITTARLDSKLVGYIINIVMPRHFYFDKKYASHLGWYVAKEHRKSSVGSRLLQESEKHLKDIGVEVLAGFHTVNMDASKIFLREGWTESEKTYLKRI